jgi:hypothetical protein
MPTTKVIRIKQFLGLDSYSDTTELAEGIFAKLENVRPRRGSLDTRNGLIRFVASSLGSNPITGLGTFWSDPSTKLLVCAYGGQLYTSPIGAPSWTAIGSAGDINTSTICQLVQYQNALIIVDQVGKARIFRKNQSLLEPLGVPDPNDYKMIEDFERTSDWTLTSGNNSTVAPDYGHFVTGLQGIQFDTSGSTNLAVWQKNFSPALDLTHRQDGSASPTTDYITLYIYAASWYSPANEVNIGLYTNTSSNIYGSTVGGALNYGPSILNAALGAYTVYIPKINMSASGSPSWSNITGALFSFSPTANGPVIVTLDFMHLQQASIKANIASSGNLNGSYFWYTTFVSDTGLESALSPVSWNQSAYMANGLNCSSNSANLIYIPTSSSTRLLQRNLYRIGGSSNAIRLVTGFGNTTTTTYVDNIADANLGAVYVTQNTNTPYIPKVIFIHNNYVILANVTDQANLTYPTGVMVSQQYTYDVYDHINNFLEIEPNQGHAIMWGTSKWGYAYLGLTDSIWQFSPENLTTPPIALSREYGGVGVQAFVKSPNGIYFYTPDNSIIFFSGSAFSDISEDGPNKVKNYLDTVSSTYLPTIMMAYYDHTVFVFIPQGSSTYPNYVLCWDEIKRQWYTINGWTGTSLFTSDTDNLYIGSPTTGLVYEALQGTTDDGTIITSTITTGDYDCQAPEIGKYLSDIYIFGKMPTGVTNTEAIIVASQDAVYSQPMGDMATGAGFGNEGFGQSPFGTDTVSTFTSYTGETKHYSPPNAGYQGATVDASITLYGQWSLREIVMVIQLSDPTYAVEGG